MCTGKVGVGPEEDNSRESHTVNHLDRLVQKRLKMNPSVSTGALRFVVNTVKGRHQTP